LRDYISKFKLTDRVDGDYYENLTKKYLSQNKYHEAAQLIC